MLEYIATTQDYAVQSPPCANAGEALMFMLHNSKARKIILQAWRRTEENWSQLAWQRPVSRAGARQYIHNPQGGEFRSNPLPQ